MEETLATEIEIPPGCWWRPTVATKGATAEEEPSSIVVLFLLVMSRSTPNGLFSGFSSARSGTDFQKSYPTIQKKGCRSVVIDELV
jgi:hypothetical protein